MQAYCSGGWTTTKTKTLEKRTKRSHISVGGCNKLERVEDRGVPTIITLLRRGWSLATLIIASRALLCAACHLLTVSTLASSSFSLNRNASTSSLASLLRKANGRRGAHIPNTRLAKLRLEQRWSETCGGKIGVIIYRHRISVPRLNLRVHATHRH